MNTAETAAVATKTYDRPYLPKGQYFAMLREQGLLKPRQPKAKSATSKTNGKAKVATEGKKAERSVFARRMYFVNKAKAAKAAGGETAPKKVYDTPYMTRGQWFKMMRETGQLAPRQPKVAAEAAVETTQVA